MRVLLTNDDGIGSEGLHVLAAAVAAAGYEVVVVAPSQDWSGAGASLGRIMRDDDIEVTRVELPGREHLEAWSIDGPPGLAVLATYLEAFGPVPDLVVSGINPGCNTGRSTLHSGTVGAALTAQNFGISGLAVSTGLSDVWQWETAAAFAVEVLELLRRAPARSVLNLNVPGLPRDQVKGLRWAELAPFGEVRTALAGMAGGRLQLELRESGATPGPTTDQGLVNAGYASLTTLVGLAEAWPATDERIGPGSIPSTSDGPTLPAPPVAGVVDTVEHIVPGATFHPVHEVPDGDEHRSLRRPRRPAPGT